ncbi:MAG: OmcA/MtrC family decaheme c-type cytochrome [Myxococcales bacterium]|nr:OmcA/MtrC family decaheme c-type cytochrome [Myxococcales bacterium]
MRKSWLLAASFLMVACEGPAGPAGQTGATGPAGGDGVAGPTGATGSDGTNGSQGEQGQQGEKGEKGDPGTPGGRGAVFTDDGLTFALANPIIDMAGVATVEFTIADGDGVALDMGGVYSAGTVSVSFILAWLDEDANGAGVYTAYTTRDQTSPITNATENQASTDSGGSFEELEPGRYRYTFGTTIAVADAAKTHTVAAYATRTIDTLVIDRNAEINFRPDGEAVTTLRELVTDAACNKCHQGLALHGGHRKDVALCITCHSPQSVDPDTGNTVDMSVMIHKIHMGADLPSVQAGEPYQIIGFRQSVNDYSDVHFPGKMARCGTCHEGPNANVAFSRPTFKACLACHDRTSMENPPPAGFTLHSAGPMADETSCAICHPTSGSIAGVLDVHSKGLLSATAPQVAFQILEITNTAPGQTPTVRFSVTVDGLPRDISTTPLTTLRLTLYGPNSDVASYWQATIQGGGATGTLTAVDAAQGEFSYAVPAAAAIPVDAAGSYSAGLEGYVQDANAVRYAGYTEPVAFAVTDAAPVARRVVVDSDKCNDCHTDLALHGDQRKNPNYCVACHNPNNDNDERFARFEGSTVWMPSVELKTMVHKIHMGAELTKQPYVLGAFPAPSAANPAGTPTDFGEVHYPGKIYNCEGCHVAGTQALPLGAGRLPTVTNQYTCTEDPATDADDYCTSPFWVITDTRELAPEASACVSCHDSDAATAHAELNTTVGGVEACATCHGPGSTWDVLTVHGGAE